MVLMMRISSIFLCLLTLFVAEGSYAADPVAAASVAKADFTREFSLPKGGVRLLGGGAERLFFALRDGSIAVTDLEGKQLHILPVKEGTEQILRKPEAAAFAEGTVYVADSELGQVVMFSADGKYEGRFGAKKGGLFGGGAEHQLTRPRGVAVHEGVVYVLDGDSKKILLFGSNGVFLSGLNVRTPAGKSAGDAAKLRQPADIKVDLAGRIYVLDADDFLVKVYSPDGEYLRALPDDGALIGLAVAQDGIYVARKNDLTIQKYDFNDRPLYRFGGYGDGAGQFKAISGIAFGKDRQVVVADTGKNTVNHFVADPGLLIEAIPRAASRTFVQSAGEVPMVVSKLAWNGKDTVYGLDREHNALVLLRNGKIEGQIKVKDAELQAVAFDGGGAAWVLDRKQRVHKIDATGKVVFSFGGKGGADGQFDDPTDMVIASSGKIYVADKGNDSVQIFDTAGGFLGAVRKLDNPVAIAVDPQDGLYVLGKGSATVSIFSAQGALVGKIGNEKDGHPGKLSEPVALMATFDEVMVLEGGAVKVYNHQGGYVRSFAAKGKGRGELDGPVAIAQQGEAGLLIAEESGKRVQAFVTQYKPVAPQALAADGGIHNITVTWAASVLPYIKQYQVYRSKNERSGFVRVGTVPGNRFVDRGLEVEGKYFYRVAAETISGYEGATSVAVSAVSKRYIPPMLEAVQAEASAWQIKLSWKAVESEFLSSYIVYQKEGETYTKVGEAITPEFTKGELQPNTKYTFYLAARSSDGSEGEKFAVTATTAAFSQAPLEIEVLKLKPIFSNSYKLYQDEGIGMIKLTNNTNKVMEGVTFSFKVNDFMDFPTESRVDKLLPGQSAEIKLRAVFNNNILNVTEDSAVQAMLEASYFDNGKRESYSKNPTVNVYEKHKLLWNERERYASFITPKDPPLLSFVRSVVTQYKEVKDEAQLAAVLFNALGVYGLTYIQDPTNPYQEVSGKTNVVDYIQFPRETLERKSGDCDDLVAFYTSSLESMGVSTRVVEVPGHMFMMFSTGIDVEEDGYNMDDMYVVYEDKLWIPVETTVVGSSFVKAWELGAENYYKWKDKGLTILDIQHAWQTYKPASLAESKWKPGEVSKEAIEKKFPNDFTAMLKIVSQTRTRHYRMQIEKNPSDVDANLQIGIVLAKLGDRAEAMKYFDKVVALQPNNAAALNNRGNLFMIEDKYVEAQRAYRAAATANPEDPYIWINLARAHKAVNEIKEAKDAFMKAQGLDPEIKKKYKALGLELSNTL